MNNKRIVGIVIGIILIVGALYGGWYFYNSKTSGTTSNVADLTKDEVEYDTDDSVEELPSSYTTINLSSMSIDGSGASISDNIINITSGGAYLITGTNNDAHIIVEVTKNENVQLFLQNVTLTSSDYAAIKCVQADKLIITVLAGTTNTLSDGSIYTLESTDDNTDATIFSKADLTINGTGTLNINGNYSNGIVSKDDLKIYHTNIVVDSSNTGINGKDFLAIKEATIKVTAGGNGLKSSNSEDTSLGYITIEDSTVTVTADQDGVEAETNLSITSSSITLTTGGGSSNASSSSSSWGSWGSSSTTESTSAKGLKADNNIIIDGGTYVLDTSDDAIHCNGSIQIIAGSFSIKTGDDGVHADSNLVINGGNIDITKSYEGLEATTILITGGTINIVASDDGINAAGGDGSSTTSDRPGANSFSSSTGTLEITGGTITIDATGDGLDSNGDINMSGGTVIVYGPTSSADGAIDYDGTFTITGGTLIAFGASGMAEMPGSSSSQYSIMANVSGSAGSTVTLTDSSGNVIVSQSSTKSYGNVVISTPDITKGTYTLDYGSSSVSITVSSVTTTYGSSGMSGGSQGGMQGGR